MASPSDSPTVDAGGFQPPQDPGDHITVMTPDRLASAFNEWMRRYTEDPTAFAAEFETVGVFLTQRVEGRTPTYGESCVAYLQSLVPSDQNDHSVTRGAV